MKNNLNCKIWQDQNKTLTLDNIELYFIKITFLILSKLWFVCILHGPKGFSFSLITLNP